MKVHISIEEILPIINIALSLLLYVAQESQQQENTDDRQ